MEMVRHQCPRQALRLRLLKQGGEPLDKRSPVGVIDKDISSLDSPDDNVLENAWNVYTCGAWHSGKIEEKRAEVNKSPASPLGS
jgi:hypothetical protein